jgi:presenilin-like A22 family membrane protease
MSKRMWMAAVVAAILMAIPVALMIVNLQILRPSWFTTDLTWGMIFLGMGMIGLGGLVAAPMPARAFARAAKG